MFCPKCGKHVEKEGTKFCTECGYQLPFISQSQYATSDESRSSLDTNTEGHQEPIQIGNSYTTQSSMDKWAERNNAPKYIASRPINSVQVKRKSKNKTAAILVAMLMIMTAVAVVVIDNNGSTTTNESGGTSTTVSSESIDGYEVSYTGAFTEGIFTYTETTNDMDNDGDLDECLMITLSSNYASQYGYFVWTVYNEDDTAYISYAWDSDSNSWVQYSSYNSSYKYEFVEYTGSSIEKTEACLYWSGYIAGDYTISVTCYDSESSLSGTTYKGELRLDGDITTTYEWTYGSNTYTLEITYTYKEFEYYHDYETIRESSGSNDISNIVDFVVVNDTISSIAEQLQKLYQKYYDSDLEGQTFANFILAFVQCCYYYPAFSSNSNSNLSYADYVMYGETEYFAYPMEVIYYGMGDCEDTSILAAAIYEACGYSAAIGILPGHAIVGVAIDDYTTPAYTSGTYEILSEIVDGQTYYAGETTVDSFQSLGVVRYYTYNEMNHKYIMFSDYIGTSYYGFYSIDD